MASSSSSSSIASPKLYDAFISHRGPDVKHTLAKQLYRLLKARGCRAFLDREEIQGGDSITFAIRNAICSSLVQIAIFSQGYAESKWCIDELVLMLQQQPNALLLLVFYDVEPWELRYIENDKSRYAAAFSDYRSKGRYLDKLDEWEKALESAADISGYELSHSSNQDNLCESIVSRVLQVVQERILLDVAKYPVGLSELVQDFESCSETKRHKRPRTMDKVRIEGIYGLGGSGKTTLAKELFNRKHSGYNASCFLSDVRESHARGELHCLQSRLLKDLFSLEYPEIKDVHHGIGQLKDFLGRARHLNFLIVLDDIDHQDQLDALLPEGMLNSSSLVIVTTRDQSMLTGADIRYKMKTLNRDHAKDLFCDHAFHRRDPPIASEKLVESFLEFCGGLPLSLKVLGAHLYDRDEYYWKLQLEKVNKIQPKDIMQSLKISFDGLDQEEKQIFIDIACFFNKKELIDVKSDVKSNAILIWNASGWSAEHAVQNLQDKCLIEVNWRGFEMHDHLRDLGRQMADDLGPPRLWRPDILRSMEAKGFKQILAETKGRCFHEFHDSSFKSKITYFIGNSNDSAETDLLWLQIENENFYLKDISSWIPLRKLQYLSVFSVEEMWSTFQQQLQTDTQASFELRKLEISGSISLLKLPDLKGMFSHLEELDIGVMSSYLEKDAEKIDITSFVQSLKQFGNLRSLSLGDFEGVFFWGNMNLSKGSLESSTSTCMTSLETIHFDSIDGISKLLISREICPRLQSLKVIDMIDLEEMDLKQLETLKTLFVEGCPKLKAIAGLSSLTGLQVFQAKGSIVVKPLHSAYEIRLEKRNKLQSVDGLEELQGLKSLIIEVPDNGYAWVRKCIHGQRRLPSDNTILKGMSMDTTLSRLDVNLFSEVIDVHAVDEIEGGRCTFDMRSSSSAITIYAFCTGSGSGSSGFYTYMMGESIKLICEGEEMITVLLTHNNSEVITIKNSDIKGGFKVTLNEGEEGKALTLMQIIVDQVYGESKD